MVSLEVGSRFRLPTGELVEVVVNVGRVLNPDAWICKGCYCNTAKLPLDPIEIITKCYSIREREEDDCPFRSGLPRTLKLVEE